VTYYSGSGIRKLSDITSGPDVALWFTENASDQLVANMRLQEPRLWELALSSHLGTRAPAGPEFSGPLQRAAAASLSHAVPSKNRGFAPAWSRTGLVKVNCSNSSGVTDPRSSSS
jgi:hypothetical protein